MRRRGHAPRRRYGRTLGGSDAFTIEKSEFGPFFVVKLTRDLAVGSGGRSVPAGTTLGTINERGTIRISRSAGYVPRGYTESAKSLLEAARHDLKESGQIMKRQRARELAEEQASGSFIAKIDGGPTIRGHDMPSTRAKVEAELLTRPVGTQAKFYRAPTVPGEPVGPGTKYEGIPWDKPFHIEETYEWNEQKRVGMPRPKGGA